jgi:hypothetical protein
LQFCYREHFKQNSHLAGLSSVSTHYMPFSEYAAVLTRPLQLTQEFDTVEIRFMICVVIVVVEDLGV